MTEAEAECLAIEEVEAEADNWMTPVIQYLTDGTCKADQEKAMKQQCTWYTMINEDLYRRGYSTPLLKCITNKWAEYILAEIHEGICGNHAGARTMAAKVLRAGYYWPTIQGDCAEYVKKCAKCQEFGPLHHTRSFAIWGMDIIGPFSPGKGQTKFLLVGVDYFTKWIEAEPLVSISAKKNKTSYGGALSAGSTSRTQ